MNVLVIGEPEKAQIRTVVEHAAKPENHYRPGPGATVPGDDSRHVLMLGTYRVVFSHTWDEGKLYRHMSVSVKGRGRWPQPEGVRMLGELYGFKGEFGSWVFHLDRAANCVLVIQEVEEQPS